MPEPSEIDVAYVAQLARLDLTPVVAFASSLDQIGPITKTVSDAALLLQVMAGLDPNDSTSLDAPVPAYRAALDGDVRGIRLGLPRNTSSKESIPRFDPRSTQR